MINYQDFIRSILKEASQIAMANFGKQDYLEKDGNKNYILTKTDLAIGKYLIEQVEKSFPEHNIIDEEAGVIDKKSQFTWVVDPIDGTSNFANGVETYGTMIGLLDGEVPIAGGMALPCFNQVYWAQKGSGAFCNEEKIFVTKETELIKTLVAYGIDGHQEDPQKTMQETEILGRLILKIRNLRSSNSIYDVAMVAKGSYGGIINKSSKIWDNVGQQVIIEEAGGIYTDYYGQPLDYSNVVEKSNQNYTFCAAPKALHEKLIKIIN